MSAEREHAERVVIVGGGPSGLATARSYRAAGGRGEVTLIGEEQRAPYERPPLSKELLRGELDERELPIEQQSWYAEHDVTLLLGASVSAIDPAAGIVAVEGCEPLRADAIVLATGAEPLREPIDGGDDPRVTTFRTVEDSLRLRRLAEPGRDRDAPVVVIGTGFIGCEVAASLALRGERAVLIGEEQLPQHERLGHEAAERIDGWLRELGVELVRGVEVARIVDGSCVELADGRAIDAACVVLGLGVRPRAQLAEAARLDVRDGAIPVDAAMRCAGDGTGDGAARVLAVGDVALAENRAAGRPLRVEHWGDALGHGEVAGRTLAGQPAAWQDVPGFWSTIGRRTLKYAAWGDGHDECRLRDHGDGAFTVWYGRGGATVGVLTHEHDEDYERGRELVAAGAALP